MKVLKLGIISFIVFAVILFLFSLLIPSTVRISRAININGSKAEIIKHLSTVEQWKSWNELSNEKINVEIVSVDSSEVRANWKYGDKSVGSACRLEGIQHITVVQWYFDFRLKWYPWEKFGSITFDKQFGPVMERSLNNLKKLVENSP